MMNRYILRAEYEDDTIGVRDAVEVQCEGIEPGRNCLRQVATMDEAVQVVKY